MHAFAMADAPKANDKSMRMRKRKADAGPEAKSALKRKANRKVGVASKAGASTGGGTKSSNDVTEVGDDAQEDADHVGSKDGSDGDVQPTTLETTASPASPLDNLQLPSDGESASSVSDNVSPSSAASLLGRITQADPGRQPYPAAVDASNMPGPSSSITAKHKPATPQPKDTPSVVVYSAEQFREHCLTMEDLDRFGEDMRECVPRSLTIPTPSHPPDRTSLGKSPCGQQENW